MRERILGGLETAHERIAALGIGAGTTIAVAHIERREVHTYHVGDSVILVVGQRGKRKHQSIPHSPVGYAVESGLLDERDAIQHEDLHLVSSLLGVGRMKLEMSSGLKLAARDTLVIASDGLYLPEGQTGKYIARYTPPSIHALAP